MFWLIIEALNAAPDAVRFVLQDVAPALFDFVREQAAIHDCIVFEDGSVDCR